MKLPRSEQEVRFACAQGRILYELRSQRGMTRKHLAKATGISQQAIFRYEMGDSTASSYDLAMLASSLGVKVETLCPDPNAIQPLRRGPEPCAENVDVLWRLAIQARPARAFA